MKIFKFIATIAAAVILATPAFAQEAELPAEEQPAPKVASGPTMDYQNEIYATAGIGTIYEYTYLLAGIFSSIFTAGNYVVDDFKTYGSYAIGWQHKVGKIISVGAAVMYNGGNYKLADKDTKATKVDSGFDVISVMAMGKLFWFQRPKIAMYSKLGVGFSMLTGFDHTSTSNTGNEKTNAFAAQITPVGIEVGGRVRGFLEYGIGSQGSCMIGVKYGF